MVTVNFNDTVSVSVTVTDSEGNTRTFNAGTQTVGAADTTATHGLTTFTADGSYTTGNYDHGPAYIVIPSGTATVTRSPGGKTISSLNKDGDPVNTVVNGMMKNPQAGAAEQGFDEQFNDIWMTYNAATNVGDSVEVTAGDILVAPVVFEPRPERFNSNLGKNVADDREGLFDGDVAVCHIVSSAPSADARPPAALGWTGRGTPSGYTVDVAAKVAAMPTPLSSTGIPMPTYSQIVTRLDHYDPLFALEDTGTTVYQALSPNQLLDGSNFGREYGGIIQGAFLALISDTLTTAQKEHVATLLLDRGIQWYDAWLNSPVSFFPPNGGHTQFHFACMALALDWTGRSADLATLRTNFGGNFLGAFEVTAALAADMAPHTDMARPFFSRHRKVLAINDTDMTVTVETTRGGAGSGDPSQIVFGDKTGFPPSAAKLQVVAGSNANILDQDITSIESPSDSVEITVDVTPSTIFAVNDDVYVVPEYIPVEGDVDWVINGTAAFNTYSPIPGALYRNNNLWSGAVLALKHLGIWNAEWDPVADYVIMANQADTPSATFDYPLNHNGFDADVDTAIQTESAFWDAHAASLGLVPSSGSGGEIVDNNTTAYTVIPSAAIPDSNLATISMWISSNGVSDTGYYFGGTRQTIRKSGTSGLIISFKRSGTNVEMYSRTLSAVVSADPAAPTHLHIATNFHATDPALSTVTVSIDGTPVGANTEGVDPVEGYGDVWWSLAQGVGGRADGLNIVDGVFADFYAESGAVRDVSLFYGAVTRPDISSVGTPQVRIVGDAAYWNGTANSGTGGAREIGSATFTDVP